MPSAPKYIEPLQQPFDVTFPDPSREIPPIPGSKSLANRALLLAALARGTSRLTGVLFSDDTCVMMRALQNLGFELEIDEPNHTVIVQGQGGHIPAKHADLHLGNAGTAMRFLTAACCLGDPGSVYTLDGIPRMRERPIGELVDALRQLGASIEYLDKPGYPPLKITARRLSGSIVEMNPSVSSQFVSALLLIAPFCGDNRLTIRFSSKPVSVPYIEMTCDILETFGCAHTGVDEQTDGQIYAVQAGPGELTASNMSIEPDASNASYFLAAAASQTGALCKIEGLHGGSYQGDVAFVDVLKAMGAHCDIQNDGITVRGTERLNGITQDLNHIPDAAMTVATLAVLADGSTTISNVGNWRVKETDRMAAMQTELTKLGAKVTVHGDDITIEPPPGNSITPASIDTYDDHRMAMAFSVIGLARPGVTINDPDCVNKTFPRFFEYLEYLRSNPRYD